MSRAQNKIQIGVDIQDGAVHVCQARFGELGPEIAAAWTEEIADGNDHFSDRAVEALRRVVRKNRLAGARAALVLQDAQALFSNAMLPTADASEIADMAALRVEQNAMLSPENSVVGQFVLDAEQPGGTRVGILAARHHAVAELLDIARSAGLTPALVTTGGLSAARYFSHQFKNQDKPAAVLYGGARCVSIYIISSKGLESVVHVSLNGSGAPDTDAVIRGLRLAADNAGGESPDRVILCGDGRGLPHPSVLEQTLGLPVSVSVGDEYSASGLLDTLRAAGAALELDPRRGSGASLMPRRTSRAAQRTRKPWMGWAAALLLLAMAAAASGTALSASRARHAELVRMDKQIKTLEPRLDDLKKQQSLIDLYHDIKAPGEQTLDVLLALSRTLPANVFVTNLSLERGRQVTVTAETTGQDSVALVIAMLEQEKMFQDVQLVYSRRADAGGAPIVTFEVKAGLAK